MTVHPACEPGSDPAHGREVGRRLAGFRTRRVARRDIDLAHRKAHASAGQVEFSRPMMKLEPNLDFAARDRLPAKENPEGVVESIPGTDG